MEDRATEIDALQIAIKEILKFAGMNQVKNLLISEANKKIAHADSIGESGNFERGIGVQLLKLTGH